MSARSESADPGAGGGHSRSSSTSSSGLLGTLQPPPPPLPPSAASNTGTALTRARARPPGVLTPRWLCPQAASRPPSS